MKLIIMLFFIATITQAQILTGLLTDGNYRGTDITSTLGDTNTVFSDTTTVGDWELVGDSILVASNDSTLLAILHGGTAQLPLASVDGQDYRVTFSAKEYDGSVAPQPIISYGTKSLTKSALTDSWQTYSFDFEGDVVNDYLEFDGGDRVSTTNNVGDSLSITFTPTTLGVQQYAIESLGDYKFSIRLETTNLLSCYSYTTDSYVVSMSNNDININTNDEFKIGQKLKTNGLMELYVNDNLFRQVAWNPSTITVSGNLALACSQGITTDGTYLYTTDANKISKYDLTGSLIASKSTVTHFGGVTYKDGYLYVAWSDNTWIDGAVSAIQKYNISDLSLVSSDTISCGRGAGAISFNADENVWVVGESHSLSNRHDHIYKYDTLFNVVDSVQTKFMSSLGVQGISYRNNKYVIMSHSSYFYLTDNNFNIEKVVYYPTWAELQDVEWISDDSLWICAKNTNAGKIAYPFTDGTKSLISFTGLNIGADRYNNRKFTGNVFDVYLSNNGNSVLNLNGADGNIDSDYWYDSSGNDNDGTISGATWRQPPYLEIELSDTAKVKIDNVVLKR